MSSTLEVEVLQESRAAFIDFCRRAFPVYESIGGTRMALYLFMRTKCCYNLGMASEPSKKILVAVDLFDASRYAWRQAGELASVRNVRKKPLEDRAFGATVERVLRRSPVPVLSLPCLRPDSPRRRKLLAEAFGLPKTS